MELKGLSGVPRVTLNAVSYEFGSAVGDTWDDNWLLVAGEVITGEQKWSFLHPSLLVDEALEIADWLDRVVNRHVAPATLDVNGDINPPLAFTEPNLAFSVQRYGDETAVIRVHFSMEALPPVQRHQEADSSADHTSWVEIEIPLLSATRAAAALRTELALLPTR